jgi:hypothetical protein
MSYFKARVLSSNSKTNDLNEIILRAINENKPQSVKQLTTILKETLDLEEEKILKSVLKLQAEGLIKLENQALQSRSFATYLKTGQALWYWVTIAVGAITAAMVFTIPEDFYPWIYARNVLGVIFVLFLPGYALIKALLPVNMPMRTSTGDLDTIERIALSLGTSIALVSIVGLLLNYSPWGIELTAIVLSLLALTVVFATAAIIREHWVSKLA